MSGLLLAMMLAAQSADLATSCHAINRGHHETNPFAPNNCKGLIAVAGAVDVPLIWVIQSKVKSGWKRAVIYGVMGGVSAVAAAHNVQVVRHPANGEPGPVVPYECGSMIGVVCK